MSAPVSLWSLFDNFVYSIVGRRPSNFEFIVGKTHLSTWPVVASIIVGYYTVIFGGQRLMRSHSPIRFNKVFQYYNLVFSLGSLFLALLIFEQVAPIIREHGLFFSICNEQAWTQPLLYLYYLAYISKYLELFDTVFLVLRKKPLQFLHCYHHGATAVLVYSQIMGRTSISWLVIELNLMVHVVMYYYYYLASRGVRVWWKKWVTRFQITQFFTDLVFIYFAVATELMHRAGIRKGCMGHCAGHPLAAFAGVFTLSSYLFLFLAFYRHTYKTPQKKAGKYKQSAVKVIDDKMQNAEIKLVTKNSSLAEVHCNGIVASLCPVTPRTHNDD
ncbi:GNS1/SUR4 family protein [Schizosaccharomyces japonicus yFS275]|uniref:Elongation of fatty acids protein n=1 Tax=Schizosaccharomyces japonicus (strain yFS275 / FY16936) TaxID=402676 RepID=B6K1F7_SCHJY|nr:GNS1/SUR4 family protein [Schizosaccharomyces japonicus yFS275]EEB07778.1 GNS1/SUR4 family protein [Schizosaccharomyces japonicus yFS275]